MAGAATDLFVRVEEGCERGDEGDSGEESGGGRDEYVAIGGGENEAGEDDFGFEEGYLKNLARGGQESRESRDN